MILIDCLVVVAVVALTMVTSGWLVARAAGSIKEGASPLAPRSGEGEGDGETGAEKGASPACVESARKALPPADEQAAAERDTGRIVGKCENLLIILFVVAGAITGMALIFTAKAFVRQKEFHSNPRYYLVGTLVNTTYSVTMGFVARAILLGIHGGSLFV